MNLGPDDILFPLQAYPVDRGLLKSKAVKYGAGGIQLFFLLVIVWFPLLLISLSNSSNISNPISSVDISITISGYDVRPIRSIIDWLIN